MSLWILAEYFLGFHTTSLDIGRYSGYFSFIIPVVFIFVALRERQSQTSGTLFLKEGINVGFRLTLISSIVLTVFLYLYNNHINPHWIDRMIEWQRKNLILNGASNDEIGRFVEQNSRQNNIFAQMVMNLINSAGVGVLITLIEIPFIKVFFKRT